MSPPQKAGSFLSFLVAAVCRREPCKFSFFFNFTVQTLFLAHIYDLREQKSNSAGEILKKCLRKIYRSVGLYTPKFHIIYP